LEYSDVTNILLSLLLLYPCYQYQIGYWWESLKERDHWEDQHVGGWTILKWVLEKRDGMVWIGLIGLRIWTTGGLL
jgi:hypothetical protein